MGRLHLQRWSVVRFNAGNRRSFYWLQLRRSGNSFKVGSAAVMDAVVKYDLARFGMAGSSIAVNVNNLLDREYVASCFQTYGCFWGAERQVVATATFRF
nr:TonB-dependent receptor [Salmonella enterica]